MGTLGLTLGVMVAMIVFAISFFRRTETETEEQNAVTALTKAVKTFFAIWFIGLAIGVAADIYTDYLWSAEVGFASTWLTRLGNFWSLFLFGVIFTFIFLWINGRYAERAVMVKEPERSDRSGRYDSRDDGVGYEEARDWVRLVKYVVHITVPVVFGLIIGGHWETVLKFFNFAKFGITDPIHGLDVSFYTFELPFYDFVRGTLFWVAGAAGVGVAALYGVYYFYAGDEKDKVLKRAIGHGSFLAGVFTLLWAWELTLGKYHLLLDGSSQRLAGASWVDINVVMPTLGPVGLLALLAGLVLIGNAFFKKLKIVAGVTLGLALLGILSLVVWPALNQVFKVGPSEIALESQYIKHSIDFTRAAFNLDKVKSQSFAYSPALTNQEYKANDPTLSQTRVMDWRPLLEANDTLQEIRVYYDFNDTDIDRYNGRELMLGVRELNTSQLPSAAQTWSNVHLQYTHGEGFTAAEISRVEAQGLPSYVVKDIPPKGPKELVPERTEVYFGELTSDWIIVDAKLEEFGQPSGTGAVYERYKGNAGVRLSGINRLAFAIRFMDLQLLLSDFITPESRILFRRSLNDRILSIAPMLKYDPDPYVVAGQDRLYWVWDAYTTTKNYPYAEGSGDFNYIRNSVKAVVDAYEGRVAFYVNDATDPVVQTWAQIFPDLFRPLREMPPFLRQHLRYPEEIFKVQAQKLALYHMVEPTEFYNREDLWVLPQEAYQDKAVTMDPRYVMIRLPGERANEFALILPFTPAGKQNLVGWLAARMDGNYGELVLILFPRDETVIGPLQVEGLINQDPQMSRDITLWNQQGSKILWGNMMVLPVLGSKETVTVLYVKPLFLLAEKGKIPALTKVLTYTGDRLIVDDDLKGTLTQLYTGSGKLVTAGQQPAVQPQPLIQPSSVRVKEIVDALPKLTDQEVIELIQALGKEVERRFGKK